MRLRIVVTIAIVIAFAWSLVVNDRHRMRLGPGSYAFSSNQALLAADEITIAQLKAWAQECSLAFGSDAGAVRVQTFDVVGREGDRLTVLDVLVSDASPVDRSHATSSGAHYVSCMGIR